MMFLLFPYQNKLKAFKNTLMGNNFSKITQNILLNGVNELHSLFIINMDITLFNLKTH